MAEPLQNPRGPSPQPSEPSRRARCTAGDGDRQVLHPYSLAPLQDLLSPMWNTCESRVAASTALARCSTFSGPAVAVRSQSPELPAEDSSREIRGESSRESIRFAQPSRASQPSRVSCVSPFAAPVHQSGPSARLSSASAFAPPLQMSSPSTSVRGSCVSPFSAPDVGQTRCSTPSRGSTVQPASTAGAARRHGREAARFVSFGGTEGSILRAIKKANAELAAEETEGGSGVELYVPGHYPGRPSTVGTVRSMQARRGSRHPGIGDGC